MATFIINEGTHGEKAVEAESYNLKDGWAHFFDADNNQVGSFTVVSVRRQKD